MLSNEKELKILEDFCNLGAIPKENIYEMILHAVEDAGSVRELEQELLEEQNTIDDLKIQICDLEDEIRFLESEKRSLEYELTTGVRT